MPKVKVGFIGCGGIAQAHMEALTKVKDAQMVAFCDLVADKAKDAAAKYGGQAFTRLEKMYDSVELDTVYIVLPPFAHGKAEMGAIERGIPFFVEKPIHMNLKQAQDIAAAVKEKGLMTCAGYMNRYRKSIQTAKATFAKDPAVLVLGGWIGGTPKKPGSPIMRWWVQSDKSAGQFVEQVTHTVDIVRFVLGEAVSVSAHAAQGFNLKYMKKDLLPGHDIDDAMAVSVKFQSGAVALLHSCCASNALSGITLDIYGVNAAARLTGWDHGMTLYQTGKQPKTIPGEPNIFEIEDAAWIKAVKTGDPKGVMSDYADGLKTLELTLAANKSAKTGRTVRLA
jgi:myo-inositol 2-dehydrogenase/D-chiro-inositol 1-dehydrogenase